MTTTFIGKAAPLSQAGFDAVLDRLGVKAPALWSLITVETRGFGFLADRRPKILFERHVFHKRTGGRYSAGHPDISNADKGGYASSEGEYLRIEQAMKLDRRAALESASWGLGQIMGFHATDLGYDGVDEMIEKFIDSEDEQLVGSQKFILRNPELASAFRSREWEKVALFYNGKAYAENEYHKKLESFFHEYELKGTPSIDVRSAQARLTYLGYSTKGVDGIVGKETRAATIAFQKANGLSSTGELNDQTMLELTRRAGI